MTYNLNVLIALSDYLDQAIMTHYLQTGTPNLLRGIIDTTDSKIDKGSLGLLIAVERAIAEKQI